MLEFRLPSLGADMESGTIVEWRVGPGDTVHRGDVVVEVETEKGLIEVEIWEDGVVDAILVKPGEMVPVGTPIALIRATKPAGAALSPALSAPSPPASPTPPAPAPPAPQPPAVAPPTTPAQASIPQPSAAPAAQAASARRRISPRARQRAAELGIDLATVRGTGEAGAITEADVRQAAPAPSARSASRPGRHTSEQLAAMRRAIGAAMARSKREIPHYYLDTQVDMSRARAWLAEQNLARPVTGRLLYAVLLLKAVALAVREVPEMNGFYVEGAFQPGPGIHVGTAISLRQGGLVAPAIHDVDRKSLDETMGAFRDLVQRARAGVLRSSEIGDATITVTSLGEQGVERVFGVIYPPQVALVGFGAVIERPWAEQGVVGVRPIMVASLAADHRVSDGHRGARFLTAIDRLLQAPEKL